MERARWVIWMDSRGNRGLSSTGGEVWVSGQLVPRLCLCWGDPKQVLTSLRSQWDSRDRMLGSILEPAPHLCGNLDKFSFLSLTFLISQVKL